MSAPLRPEAIAARPDAAAVRPPSRFANKEEWRAHMERLATAGGWKRRNWIQR